MEICIFKYGSYSYEYYLVRQTRKTISLTVQPNLKMILKCPVDCDEDKIQAFLKRKWKWFEKQLSFFGKFKSKVDKEYISGESFLYLGRQYKLLVRRGKEDEVKLKFGKILLRTTKRVNNKKYNRKLLENWYYKRSIKIFEEQYDIILKDFDYNHKPTLILRKMSRRWGSFLNDKKIILNPILIQAPKECINYVITHELCHIKYKHHNKFFYNLLKNKMPNWKEVKEKLELRFL